MPATNTNRPRRDARSRDRRAAPRPDPRPDRPYIDRDPNGNPTDGRPYIDDNPD